MRDIQIDHPRQMDSKMDVKTKGCTSTITGGGGDDNVLEDKDRPGIGIRSPHELNWSSDQKAELVWRIYAIGNIQGTEKVSVSPHQVTQFQYADSCT